MAQQNPLGDFVESDTVALESEALGFGPEPPRSPQTKNIAKQLVNFFIL